MPTQNSVVLFVRSAFLFRLIHLLIKLILWCVFCSVYFSGNDEDSCNRALIFWFLFCFFTYYFLSFCVCVILLFYPFHCYFFHSHSYRISPKKRLEKSVSKTLNISNKKCQTSPINAESLSTVDLNNKDTTGQESRTQGVGQPSPQKRKRIITGQRYNFFVLFCFVFMWGNWNI